MGNAKSSELPIASEVSIHCAPASPRYEPWRRERPDGAALEVDIPPFVVRLASEQAGLRHERKLSFATARGGKRAPAGVQNADHASPRSVHPGTTAGPNDFARLGAFAICHE